MDKTYRRVKLGCGAAAALGAAGYLATLTFTAYHDSVDMPIEVTGLALAIISLCIVIAAGCWIVERALSGLSTAVAEQLAERLEPRLRRAVDKAGARTVKHLHESITGPLMQDQLDAAIGRARVLGMIREASQTDHPNGGGVAQLRRG